MNYIITYSEAHSPKSFKTLSCDSLTPSEENEKIINDLDLSIQLSVLNNDYSIFKKWRDKYHFLCIHRVKYGKIQECSEEIINFKRKSWVDLFKLRVQEYSKADDGTNCQFEKISETLSVPNVLHYHGDGYYYCLTERGGSIDRFVTLFLETDGRSTRCQLRTPSGLCLFSMFLENVVNTRYMVDSDFKKMIGNARVIKTKK